MTYTTSSMVSDVSAMLVAITTCEFVGVEHAEVGITKIHQRLGGRGCQPLPHPTQTAHSTPCPRREGAHGMRATAAPGTPRCAAG
eukprot:353579-Chlamydomonas_euryale.AAC.2